MRTIQVKSWAEFQSHLAEYQRQSKEPAKFHFRGQANACWDLQTTLERSGKVRMLYEEYYRKITVIKPEIESFTAKEWHIEKYEEVLEMTKDYDPFSMMLSGGKYPAFSYMIYLRHHGFPSPLLDWSRSASIAAFFAFRKAVAEAAHVSMYVLREIDDQCRSSDLPQLTRLGPHTVAHKRHFLQQSDYTLYTKFDLNTGWSFVKLGEGATPAGFEILKFEIPTSERPLVLKQLASYNLHASSLFGSEESLMETLAARSFDGL